MKGQNFRSPTGVVFLQQLAPSMSELQKKWFKHSADYNRKNPYITEISFIYQEFTLFFDDLITQPGWEIGFLQYFTEDGQGVYIP